MVSRFAAHLDKLFDQSDVNPLESYQSDDVHWLSDAKQACPGSVFVVSPMAAERLTIPVGEYVRTEANEVALISDRSYAPHRIDPTIFDTLAGHIGIREDKSPAFPQAEHGESDDNDHTSNLQHDGEGRDENFALSVDRETVDRPSLMTAIENAGFTLTDLANKVGVDVPAISRLLRTPVGRQGDPGGRNPSAGLAGQICKALRADPTALFPDIFGSTASYKPRQQPGNKGSGTSPNSAKKGQATQKWTQGNMGEEAQIATALVAICEQLHELGTTPEEFFQLCLAPAMMEAEHAEPTKLLNEFLDLKSIFGGLKKKFSNTPADDYDDGTSETTDLDATPLDAGREASMQRAMGPYANKSIDDMDAELNQSPTDSDPAHPANRHYSNMLKKNAATGTTQPQRFEDKKNQVRQEVVKPMAQRFMQMLNSFRKDTYDRAYLGGAGKMGPITKALADRLYKGVAWAAQKALAPNFKMARPGENPHQADYEAGRSTHLGSAVAEDIIPTAPTLTATAPVPTQPQNVKPTMAAGQNVQQQLLDRPVNNLKQSIDSLSKAMEQQGLQQREQAEEVLDQPQVGAPQQQLQGMDQNVAAIEKLLS
jgi:transcriptional regulator with XRE-family HTH domain